MKKSKRFKRFKEWLDILTKVSTIGGLIVATLAYYYTIKPVFDEKKLKSEIVELKKEKVSLHSELLVFTDDLKLKKEETVKLSNKIDNLKNENLKIEWRLFLNILNEKNSEPDVYKFDLIHSILSTGSLELSFIEDTDEEQELYNDKYILLKINKLVNEFNYSPNLGIIEHDFNEFKKILKELIKLNEGHLIFEIKFPIEMKEKINNEIKLLKQKKDITISELKYISEKRRKYKTLLNERKIISAMAIRSFLKNSLSALDNIKTIKK